MDGTPPPVFVIEIDHNSEINQVENTSETIDANKTNKVNTDKSIKNIIDECFQWMKVYIKRYSELHQKRPKRLTWDEYFWTFIGSFVSIALVAIIHYNFLEKRQLIFLIGSAGATTMVLFCSPHSPVAQPRNLIGGHLIGAICGCVMRVTLNRVEPSIACALTVSLSIAVMQFTETIHPPGGAIALIAVTNEPSLPWANFLFVLVPALTAPSIMLVVSLFVNNIPSTRTYPTFWWK